MGKFVVFTVRSNNCKLILNVDSIVGVFEQPDKQCVIEIKANGVSDDTIISVKETFKQIEERLLLND